MRAQRLSGAVVALCLLAALAAGGCLHGGPAEREGPASLRARSQIVEDLYDTHFVSADEGWAVGVFGTVYHTRDAGKSWRMQPTPTLQHLYSVTFLDDNTGFAAGREGEIVSTSDRGATWVRRKSGTTKHLFKIAFNSRDSGWAIGDWGVVVHTRNGGLTWKDRSLANDQILYSIAFADENNGWMVGEFATILHTTDGGDTWQPQATGTQKTFFGVAATSPNDAWVIGIDGLIYRTRDAGATWTLQHGEPATAGFEELGFTDLFKNPGLYDIQISGQTGYIVGDIGSVYVTKDGGETWIDSPLPADWRLQWIRGLSVDSSGRGMIVGAAGLTFVVEGTEKRFSQAPL